MMKAAYELAKAEVLEKQGNSRVKFIDNAI